jgi:N-acetylglutamate synthase-like GNAT family acetyltransferase
MELRPYQSSDQSACLTIHHNEPQLEAYLASSPEHFYVMEHEGSMLGCGGFSLDSQSAQLHWGAVHPDWRRQGLGRYLLMYRLKEISRQSNIEWVYARVPGSFASFYERNGFRLHSADGDSSVWAKRLAVCS